MDYVALIIAWAIVIAPWAFFVYSLLKLLEDCGKKWLMITLATIFLSPLYYMILFKLSVDFGQ